MINFFRRIRQRLLSQNKLSQYFLYAIGEIILVVVGILIALSINNWNTNKQSNERISAYLSEIQTNINKDAQIIDLIIEGNKIKNYNLVKTIDFYYRMEENIKYRDSTLNMLLQATTYTFAPFDVTKTGYNALLNFGQLNYISDSLRINLDRYYSSVYLLENYNERVDFLTRDAVQNKLFKSVATREEIRQFARLEPKPKKQLTGKFEASDDIVQDILILTTIEDTRNQLLAQLKIDGNNLKDLIRKELSEK